jgi:hypothetical protein
MVFSIRRDSFRRAVFLLFLCVAPLAGGTGARAQGVDCDRLRSLIAQGDRGGSGSARAARRQAAEFARTQAYAHQLGCDRSGFLFFGGGGDNPQCPALNARLQQIQANLQHLQGGGGGGRQDLIARYNASCRGAQPPQPRGFFESLFGGPDPAPAPPPNDVPPSNDEPGPDDGGSGAHGGGQAICVRTCDGGFFPLPISARHSGESLSELCSALCPGTEATVFTRSPSAEIKTAMSLDGKPYMDLPNALKFEKSYSATCSCRPAGKSWAEVLDKAEEVLGNQRKGDIVVTQEKADEMSRPKLDPKARAALLNQTPGTAAPGPSQPGEAAPAGGPAPNDMIEVTGPDGSKRLVRRVGPQN